MIETVLVGPQDAYGRTDARFPDHPIDLVYRPSRKGGAWLVGVKGMWNIPLREDEMIEVYAEEDDRD